jgi:choline dehydrogenase-like flavoprotein
MTLVDHEFYHREGFILSTFINSMKISRFAELDTMALTTPTDKLLGLMVKIRDERTGSVHADGTISKPVTQKDQTRLDRGVKIAKEILVQAGIEENSFMISKPQGAHPGGTAAIGEVVNNKLETEVENLFVCDASVLPVAPGLPPILTIVALGKWLAKSMV